MNIARWAFVALLSAMAAAQAADFGAFRDIVHSYQFGPGWVMSLAAAGLVAGEAAGALALASRRMLPGGALVALGVAIAWSALGAQAFVRGLEIDNCGCFGRFFGQELRWWVLAQDAWFVASAAFLAAKTFARRSTPEAHGRAFRCGGRDPSAGPAE